jgi:hypothetical protein
LADGHFAVNEGLKSSFVDSTGELLHIHSEAPHNQESIDGELLQQMRITGQRNILREVRS